MSKMESRRKQYKNLEKKEFSASLFLEKIKPVPYQSPLGIYLAASSNPVI